MIIQIESAGLTDLDAINSLMRVSKAYWNNDSLFLDLFMEKCSITVEYLKTNTLKLFLVNGSLAGFYSFIFHEDEVLELDNFFLHTDYIGKKLGEKLWQNCCKTAIELNQKEFILWADPNAEGFYLKMGCKKIGVRKSPLMSDRYPPVMKFMLSANG